MRRVFRWNVLLPVCLAAAMLTAGSASTQDKKPETEPLSRSAIDGLLYANLRDVINHGAILYNSGDWNGCYRLYEGALMSVRPLLGHHRDLQKAIDDGITNAQQDPMLFRRAFVLRKILDRLRADLKGVAPAKKSKKALSGGPSTKSLWDRLGGETGVSNVIDDLVNAAVADPKIDFFRGGTREMNAKQIVKMKREIVEQVSQAAGGPLRYDGPDMRSIHQGMGISNEQFNAVAGHLKKALEKNQVASADVEQVLRAVEGFRKIIVEKKKPDK